MRRAILLVCLLTGCEGSLLTGRSGAPDAAASEPDADRSLVDAGSSIEPPLDAGPTPMDAGPALPPPAARPPSAPPDLSHVIAALAAERPELLAGSCVEQGGTNDFLFESARRLRAIDPRWGLDRRGGSLGQDVVDYFYGDGAPEGRAEVYVVDIIGSHCGIAGVHAPPSAGWIDVSDRGGVWTLAGLDGSPPPPPEEVDAGAPPPSREPPDMRHVLAELAAERPDLLASSCVEHGGNNEFLFESVRRLRRIDARWGLNWKRGNVGDLSQDVVDYHFGTGDPEGSTDVAIIDVIGGHCGDAPSAAWTDVTEATRLGGTIGRWTLAGRTDL